MLRAWMIRHRGHGLILDTLVLLPDGDTPDTNEDWVRVPALDAVGGYVEVPIPVCMCRLGTCEIHK